jgi:hypothetical protein
MKARRRPMTRPSKDSAKSPAKGSIPGKRAGARKKNIELRDLEPGKSGDVKGGPIILITP